MVGFSTLRELIGKTPAKSQDWLQLLLELTTAEREQVFNPISYWKPSLSTLPNIQKWQNLGRHWNKDKIIWNLLISAYIANEWSNFLPRIVKLMVWSKDQLTEAGTLKVKVIYIMIVGII